MSVQIARLAGQAVWMQIKGEYQRSILGQAARHFDAGELRVQVGAMFPLEQAADAQRARKS